MCINYFLTTTLKCESSLSFFICFQCVIVQAFSIQTVFYSDIWCSWRIVHLLREEFWDMHALKVDLLLSVLESRILCIGVVLFIPYPFLLTLEDLWQYFCFRMVNGLSFSFFLFCKFEFVHYFGKVCYISYFLCDLYKV